MRNQLAQNIIGSVEMHRGRQLPEGMYVSSVSNASPNGKPLMNAMGKMPLNNAADSSLGFQIDIDTLTEIRQKIIEQKFYEVAVADFMPVVVGFGAWSEQLLTYRAYQTSDDFESGIVDTATNSRLSEVNIGIDSVQTKVIDWAKMLGYSLMDVQKAQKSGNWSLIEQLEKSRKKNWDLGIQKVGFLGHSVDTNVTGLLNNAGVTNNTSLITEALKDMTDAEFQTFITGLLQAYFSNSDSTAFPDTFAIPMSDWLGLGKATSATYPVVNRRQYLINEFREATKNPNAQVVPLAYGDSGNNGLGVQRYVLYKNDADVLDMNIPVDYTSTVIGSINNFQFQNVAYGQFTGVQMYRPKEVLYFSY